MAAYDPKPTWTFRYLRMAFALVRIDDGIVRPRVLNNRNATAPILITNVDF